MSMIMIEQDVAGVVLAGGLSRRMGGGDKGLKEIGGKPILDRVIATIKPQLAALAINANGDSLRFSNYELPIIPDGVADFPGPLAGILAGLDWEAAALPSAAYLLSVPTDTPFLPDDLVMRLRQAVREGAELASVISGGQTHPVIGLWPVSLRDELRQALIGENLRKIDRFTARYRLALVEYPLTPCDPFFNVNTPEDVELAEGYLVGP
jgi:molybdopterin-guanine dinucleotide biosynthesis protein A